MLVSSRFPIILEERSPALPGSVDASSGMVLSPAPLVGALATQDLEASKAYAR